MFTITTAHARRIRLLCTICIVLAGFLASTVQGTAETLDPPTNPENPEITLQDDAPTDPGITPPAEISSDIPTAAPTATATATPTPEPTETLAPTATEPPPAPEPTSTPSPEPTTTAADPTLTPSPEPTLTSEPTVTPEPNLLTCEAGSAPIVPGASAATHCIYTIMDDTNPATVTAIFATSPGPGWLLDISDAAGQFSAATGNGTAIWQPGTPLPVGTTINLIVQVHVPIDATPEQQGTIIVTNGTSDPVSEPAISWITTVASPEAPGDDAVASPEAPGDNALAINDIAAFCTPVVTIASSESLLDFGSTTWLNGGWIPAPGVLILEITPDITGGECTGMIEGTSILVSAGPLVDSIDPLQTMPNSVIQFAGAATSGTPPEGVAPVAGAFPLSSSPGTIATTTESATATGGTWDVAFTLNPPADTPAGTYNGTITIDVSSASGG